MTQKPTTAVATRPAAPVAPIETEFDALIRFGGEMVKTGFLPNTVRTGAQAAAIVLTGRELGIGPMAALRSISIVQGRPVVAADLQLALFKRAGGRAHIEIGEDAASITLVHPNGDEHTETFTVEDAKAAGLLNKDNWKNYRKAMLRSRVITSALKASGFLATAGVYDPDELAVETETRPAVETQPYVFKAPAQAASPVDTEHGEAVEAELTQDEIPPNMDTADEPTPFDPEPPSEEPPADPDEPPVKTGGRWDEPISEKQPRFIWGKLHATGAPKAIISQVVKDMLNHIGRRLPDMQNDTRPCLTRGQLDNFLWQAERLIREAVSR